MLLAEAFFYSRKVLALIKGLIKGLYPRFRSEKKIIRLSTELETFNEKILHRMRSDRNPMLKMFSDKLQTRDYVANLGLGQILPDLYWTGDALPELAVSLPKFQSFVLKPSKGSGATIICLSTLADEKTKKFKVFSNPWGIYLYNSKNFDLPRSLYLCSKWINEDYSKRKNVFEEWAYSGHNQKIIMEEVLLDRNDQLPKDYKVFVFHGKAKLIQVDYDRFGKHTRSFYTPVWEKLDLTCIYPLNGTLEEKPEELQEMLAHAEAIGNQINFIRLDFYITANGLKFGEATVYPGGGVDKFEPLELNRKIASYW